MSGLTPRAAWRQIRRARLIRVLAVYLSVSFVVLQLVDILTIQLGLPDWFFPGALVLLLLGLPIISATALVQSPAPASKESESAAGPAGAARDAAGETATEQSGLPSTHGGTPAPGPAAGSVEPGAGPAEPVAGPAEPAPEPTAVPVEPAPGTAPRTAPAASAPPPTPTAALLAGLRGWLTWRRAILGGVAAFALWGLVVSGYMAMRALGVGPVGSLVAAGVIEHEERVLVADFANRSDDEVLGTAVTEAFRVDLAQSPVLRVVSPAVTADALARMGRAPDTPLHADIAREVAVREGIKAVVAGEIHQVGSGYVLSAHLLSAADGDVLATFRENAADDGALIPAIGRLSQRLRERAGESLRTIRAGEPLERVTTASLDALRRYSQADRIFVTGDYAGSIPLLEDAIAEDPGFAMAHRKLGIALSNLGIDRIRQLEALRQAYAHRDRLTDRERYLATAAYQARVLGDHDRAQASYEALLRLDPEETTALNNAGLYYLVTGQSDRAEPLLRRALDAGIDFVGTYNLLVAAQWALGRPDDAWATYAEQSERFPESLPATRVGAWLASASGDYDAARAAVLERLDAGGLSFAQRALLVSLLADLDSGAGRLEAAEHRSREAAELFERAGQKSRALVALLRPALADAIVLGEPSRTVDRIAELLERDPLDGLPPTDRPYLDLAAALAAAGRTDSARELLATYEAEVASLMVGEDGVARVNHGPAVHPHAHRMVRGMLALAEGRAEDAVPELRRMAEEADPCRSCDLALLGMAYEEAGVPDSAAAVYQRYVDMNDVLRVTRDWLWLGPALERLAALHEAAGRPDLAAEALARLVDLWREADPVLQPRVDAAHAALARLAAEAEP